MPPVSNCWATWAIRIGRAMCGSVITKSFPCKYRFNQAHAARMVAAYLRTTSLRLPPRPGFN